LDHYSPERRTALVLSGTGADGAYHAGVLRALREAGVKIDVVGGRGIGAVAALLTAIDGAARLWEPKGLWRAAGVRSLYRWRWPLRLVLATIAAIAGVLLSPLLFLAAGVVAYVIGLVLGMAGIDAGASVMRNYADTLAAAFAPGALPTWLPRLVTLLVLAALVTLGAGAAIAASVAPLKRRSQGGRAWALIGAPLDASAAMHHFISGIWDLLKGGANVKTPAAADLSRRFAELLSDNLGQPGFSELLLTIHDLDARRDLVFGLVREPYRRALFPPPTAVAARRAETFDLAGLARDHVVDVLRASLSIPGLTEPALVRFAADAYWRGEAHRLADRPGSLARLLEEAAAAGAEQLILVSAAADPPGPHELRRPRLDPMGRLSDYTASLESAVVRDALHHLQHRFRAVYVVRPAHNPIGALDLRGAYDERSDRIQPLSELIEQGYADAYHQFVEPVVAASGENLPPAGTL
jgi:predicted acylesterase/phospholipase RssA